MKLAKIYHNKNVIYKGSSPKPRLTFKRFASFVPDCTQEDVCRHTVWQLGTYITTYTKTGPTFKLAQTLLNETVAFYYDAHGIVLLKVINALLRLHFNYYFE